jgi:hypothetical protein
MPYSIASLTGFLRAEGAPTVPLGLDKEATDFGGRPPYQKRLAEDFAPTVTNDEAEDAVHLYRRLLAAAEEKVEIIEIGYPQVLANLLTSGPDELSDKDGLTLVREKVKKMWVMAGKWDADGEMENNFCRNDRSRRAAKLFCDVCPVPVTFLGWEVGFDVLSGGELSGDDHLYRVLADHGSENGRSSWDPMLMLLALLGDEEAAGYRTVTGRASVDEQTGANHFTPTADGSHRFVIKKEKNSYYADKINAFL